MSNQSVFHPLLNFWTSAWLVVASPKLFYSSFTFLAYPKRYCFLYGLLYTWLAALIGMLGVRLQISFLEVSLGAEGLAAMMYSPSMVALFLFLILPVFYVMQLLVGAALILVIASFTRTEFTIESAFNVLASLAPFTFASSLVSMGLIAVFQVSFVQSVLAFFFGLFLMVMWFRSFHTGSTFALQDQLAHDPKALNRFYFGVLGAIGVLFGLMFLLVLFIALL